MRVPSIRKSVLVMLAVTLGLTGCASAGGGGGGSNSGPNRISRDELIALGQASAYDAVEQLRRRWLQARGTADGFGGGTASLPEVYVDGSRRGDMEYLRSMQADQIGSMEYLSAVDATTRFGLNHDGGAILVSTDTSAGGFTPDGGATASADQGGNSRPRNTSNTRDAEDALEDADEADSDAEAQTFLETAVRSAQAAIAENPQNPLGHRLAALAYMGLENYEEAGAHFTHAGNLWSIFELEDLPMREQAFIDLYSESIPFMNSGAYEDATGLLADANAIYPLRPEAMVALAQIFAQDGQYDESIAYMDEAMAFMQSDQVEEADSVTIASWVDMTSDLPLLRAQVQAGAGRFEEAVGTYREIAVNDPNNVAIKQDLGAILIQMGNSADAIGVYQDILTLPGLTGNDYYRVGVGFYSVEDYGQAADAFGQGVEASPMDRDGLEMWARTLQLDSMYAEAAPAAERWAELDPASQIALTVWAQAANAAGNAERAGEIIGMVDELTFTVDELQFRRFGGGGGTVSGAVTNKSLEQGAQVTLEFTFYSDSGSPMGTVTQTVTVGAAEMAQVFSVQFDSAEYVGGYAYEAM